MRQSHEAAVLNTYRYLRLATIPLLLMLLISVALESLRGTPCLLGSISAYYYTPARGAFIGGLFAVGACLIVYKGNDPLEDVLLDFSGFMAFVVALVPTIVDTSCGAKYPTQNLDLTAEAVRNNITTLLIATALAVAARWWLVRRDRRRAQRTNDLEGREEHCQRQHRGDRVGKDGQGRGQDGRPRHEPDEGKPDAPMGAGSDGFAERAVLVAGRS